MDEELRGRIRIQYVDSYGEVEAGVDGGGLFKDFMENLVKEGFNPEIGLFRTTPEQKLYPSPAASSAVPNALALFEFLGKMLGKAMYEVGIQLGTHADFTRAVDQSPPGLVSELMSAPCRFASTWHGSLGYSRSHATTLEARTHASAE